MMSNMKKALILLGMVAGLAQAPVMAAEPVGDAKLLKKLNLKSHFQPIEALHVMKAMLSSIRGLKQCPQSTVGFEVYEKKCIDLNMDAIRHLIGAGIESNWGLLDDLQNSWRECKITYENPGKDQAPAAYLSNCIDGFSAYMEKTLLDVYYRPLYQVMLKREKQEGAKAPSVPST